MDISLDELVSVVMCLLQRARREQQSSFLGCGSLNPTLHV